MKTRRAFTFLGIGIIVALAWVYGAQAQTAARPTIVSFSSEVTAITPDALEQGGDAATTTLSWHIIDVTDDLTIVLEQFQFDSWQPVLAEEEVLAPVDSREIVLLPSYGFNPPTYRLSVTDAEDNVLNQYLLVIPFDTEALSDLKPVIDSFSLGTTSVDINTLAVRTALVPATWSVSSRLPTANLAFEQIMPDGNTVSAELPRERLWVAAHGAGMLAPTPPSSGSEIRFRLSVVDVVSGEVYAWKEAALPVTGVLQPTVPPTAPPPPTVTNNTGNASSPVQIVSFTASPNPADPAGKVTLAWEVRGATYVSLSWSSPTTGETRYGLPLRGTLEVNLRDVWFFGSDMTIFSLIPTDANNQGYNDLNGWLITTTVEVKLKTNMVIHSFTTNVATAKRLESIVLSWNVSNAAKVIISDPAAVHDTLPIQGSYSFTLPNTPYDQVNFFLEAVDVNGVTLRRELNFPIICNFVSQLKTGCALTQATVSAVYQSFQYGSMIWRGDTREIYVLYNDGVLETYQDTWVDGEILNIADTPPGGMFAPVRGFGKVWANNAGVRAKLGWATITEASYSTLVETVFDDFGGRFAASSTYLRYPSNRVLRLHTSWSTWELWG